MGAAVATMNNTPTILAIVLSEYTLDSPLLGSDEFRTPLALYVGGRLPACRNLMFTS